MANEFGKYEVYTVAGSIYCYRDTNVLKNRFGIREWQGLKALEADISAIRQNGMLNDPVRGRFTPNHLCRIHSYLLGDIYPFAGHYRREDIMKGTTRFLSHTQIKNRLSELLQELKAECFLQKLSDEDFVERSVYYFAELNYIHPWSMIYDSVAEDTRKELAKVAKTMQTLENKVLKG